MSIPLTIDQLSNLENYKDDSKEVIDWFKQNGFLKVFVGYLSDPGRLFT